MAKAVCPDAYSYAFDDGGSTFILPAGGGWEVRFCPVGARSTRILEVWGGEMRRVAGMGLGGGMSGVRRGRLGRVIGGGVQRRRVTSAGSLGGGRLDVWTVAGGVMAGVMVILV